LAAEMDYHFHRSQYQQSIHDQDKILLPIVDQEAYQEGESALFQIYRRRSREIAEIFYQ
jgi:hypothetical protein